MDDTMHVRFEREAEHDNASKDERRERRRERNLYDADILDVEGVADLLRCSVDHVRRIPRTELRARRVAKRILYLREDVKSYLASRPVQGESRFVRARAVDKRTSDAIDDGDDVVRFDPKKALADVKSESQ